MIDQIGTGEPNGRIISKRRVARTAAMIVAAGMVTAIMAVWSAFLVWAAFRALEWLVHFSWLGNR